MTTPVPTPPPMPPHRLDEPHALLTADIESEWHRLLSGVITTERRTLLHSHTLRTLVQRRDKRHVIALKQVVTAEVANRACGILLDAGYRATEEKGQVMEEEVGASECRVALEAAAAWVRTGWLLERAETQVVKQRLFMIYRQREVELGGGVERGWMEGGGVD